MSINAPVVKSFLFRGLFLVFLSVLIINWGKMASVKTIANAAAVKAVKNNGKMMLLVKKSDGTEEFVDRFRSEKFDFKVKLINNRLTVVVRSLVAPVKENKIRFAKYRFDPERYICDGSAIVVCNIFTGDPGYLHIIEEEGCHLVLHMGSNGPVITGYAEIETSNSDDVWYLNCWIANDPVGVVAKL